MIKIEKTKVMNLEGAIRGMRNPLESWEKSDSYEGPNDIEGAQDYILGESDLKLATTLANAGSDHGKFLRQIFVSMDITAPLFWWKEFDTYKVGTVANSTSTMHTISKKPITMESFSFDFFFGMDELQDRMCELITIVSICEGLRKKYLEALETNKTLAEQYWRMLIEILPNGWLQTRTITLNYAVLRNMYHARKNHKLKEWHMFCEWIETLPYAEQLIIGRKENTNESTHN
jgi:hypothetical protein